MRFSTFVPAVLAITLFAASTAQAERNNLDVIAETFVKTHTQIAVEASVHLTAELCADVLVDATVKANVLDGLVTADVDIEDLKLQTKAAVQADIKAVINADLKADVILKIDAHVRKVILDLCPHLEDECIKENEHKIVADVNAEIDLDIQDLKADVEAHVNDKLRLRLKAFIKEVAVHAGVAEVAVHAKIWVASDVEVHLDAFLKVWAKLWANVKIPKLFVGAV